MKNAITVVLEKDLHEGNAEALAAAISQMRGVLSVKLNVSDLETHIATERARHDLIQSVWNVLKNPRVDA